MELIRLSPDRHFFYQRVHHLLLDGYSAVLVLQRGWLSSTTPCMGGRRRRAATAEGDSGLLRAFGALTGC